MLNAWLDFNDDGDWLDDGEYFFADLPSNTGTQVLEFAVPSTAVVTNATVARFRLSTQSALWFTGQAPDGEIEDHTVRHCGETTGGTIAGRQIFYNNSAWDGHDPAAMSATIAPSRPTNRCSCRAKPRRFANYTSYSRGINGLIIDVLNLWGTPTVDDFLLRTGNDNAPDGSDPNDPADDWPRAPDPVSITVRPGAGVGGADRVTLIWDDGAIQRRWLQVTMLANNATGLAQSDVFYVGNAVGESGNSTTDAIVNATDEIGARNNPHSPFDPAALDEAYDFDRDKLVNATDQIVARNNRTSPFTALRLITPPPESGGGEGEGEGEGEAGGGRREAGDAVPLLKPSVIQHPTTFNIQANNRSGTSKAAAKAGSRQPEASLDQALMELLAEWDQSESLHDK